MSEPEVLILHGPPGSGKSTLARGVSEHLREAGETHAVIDLDELNIVYPGQGSNFLMRNLKAIWPNYAALPHVKVLIPTVIPDREWYETFIDATPAARRTICELIASERVLKERVTRREPNAFWQERLRNWVDVYLQRDDNQRFGHFQVTTDRMSIEEAVREIVRKGFSPRLT
jgi:hypothetical protein